MGIIILDLGSGNGRGNVIQYQREVIDYINFIDRHRHKIILKYQLFQKARPNIPLDPKVFDECFAYGTRLGYQVTASVFDKPSLKFLLEYPVPFVKIACQRDKYPLVGEVKRRIDVLVSVEAKDTEAQAHLTCCRLLLCVPDYPAAVKSYGVIERFSWYAGVSDHTEGLELWKSNHAKVELWEKHFTMERDPKNPDAAAHSLDKAGLKEMIG